MLLVIIFFFLFMLLGMPVVFAIAISGFLFFLQHPEIPITTPIQLPLTQNINFALLAIPLFITAGNMMNYTGITKRLIDLSMVLVGHLRGGLAHVTCVLSALMGGVSGSAIADAAMEARMLGPEMIKRGLPKGYAAGALVYSSLEVPTIPPSIGLVLFGTIAQVSIGRLFAGGIIPGLLVMTFLMITVAITSRIRNFAPLREKRASIVEIGISFIKSIWAIIFPVILIVGLRGGLFTPFEIGALCVVYALFVGILAYRELTLKNFIEALRDSTIDIGATMSLIAFSNIFSYGIVWERIPEIISSWILGITTNPYIFYLILIALLLVAGCFIDATVLILMLSSIFFPIAIKLGIDPVHFGLVFVMTCAIGNFIPPVGAAMYAVCTILDVSLEEFLKESWPFLLAVVLAIVTLIFFPSLVLFIPNLIFGK
ncbi:TRAP transporter large permease [Dictyoglomus turgidum]|uniref:TRAP transporter large permease n=1 Tax=Dictyoglomus turgidum TaxID=513050 RepID=UPI00235721A2|nr:TRAP transporter large permease [Dictyoglomus turgidum]